MTKQNKTTAFFREHKLGRILVWLSVCLFPLYLTLISCYISSPSMESLHSLLVNETGAFLYGFLIVAVLFFAAVAFLPRVDLAAGILSILAICMPLVDFFKVQILKEHFLPWDILMAGNAASFTDFVTSLVFPKSLLVIIPVTVLYCLFFTRTKPTIPIPWTNRAALAPALLVFLYGYVMNEDERVYAMERHNISITKSMDQGAIYDSYGFLTGFTLNLGALDISKPQSYNKSYVERAFRQYLPAAESGETFENPDIIVILSESFWDPTVLKGVTFSDDPLKNYRAIAEEHIGGDMVSCTFGGGTVRPEFEILSGLTTSVLPTGNIPYQQYMSRDVFSYAQLYKGLGYDTLGLHTYQKTFYDRENAYPHMGFDAFLGEYDLNAEHHWNSGPYITDETLAEEIIYQLEQPHDTGLYMMAISMENHGLYREKYDPRDWDISVSGESLNEQQIISLQNYATGVQNADQALQKIYDYVMSREKPTAVLWYGDHLPTLGEDFMPYTTTGTISSTAALEWSQEEKMTMFTTPYLIFTNYDTGRDYLAEDTPVSPYLLSALLADYIDAPQCLQTNFLLDMLRVCPVNSPYYELYSEGSYLSQRADMMELHEILTYDQLIGEQYTLDMEFKAK